MIWLKVKIAMAICIIPITLIDDNSNAEETDIFSRTIMYKP